MDVFVLLGQVFNLRPRWIAIRLRIIEAQAVGRARPKTAALIFMESSHRRARQSLFNSVFDPRALGEAVQTTVGSYPNAAVPVCSHQRIDSVEAPANLRPIPAIELPDSVRGRAPNSSLGQFHERDRFIRAALISRSKGRPFVLMTTGRSAFSTDPQIAILCL